MLGQIIMLLQKKTPWWLPPGPAVRIKKTPAVCWLKKLVPHGPQKPQRFPWLGESGKFLLDVACRRPAKSRFFREETAKPFSPDDLPLILPVDPHVIPSKMTLSGYIVSTYPSEKWWSSSVGMMIIPIRYGKSFKIPWFQSPPSSYRMIILLLAKNP